MTDETGQKNRPGAGSYSLEMHVEGLPMVSYFAKHIIAQTGHCS